MGVKDTFRRYGWLAASQQALYRLVQRCLSLHVTHLMTMRLDQPNCNPELTDEIDFRPLTCDEFTELANQSDLKLDTALAKRISPPLDSCFAGVRHGRLVAFLWLATDSIEASHNSTGDGDPGVALSFPANTVYTYNAFVHPRDRGKGIYAHLVHAGCLWAHQVLQVDRLISTVEWTNRAAIRGCRRQGRRSIGLIWQIVLFGPAVHLCTIGRKNLWDRMRNAANVKSRNHPAPSAGQPAGRDGEPVAPVECIGAK